MIPLPRTPRSTLHALHSPDRSITSVSMTELIELASNSFEARLAAKTSVHGCNSARLPQHAACNTAPCHTCAGPRIRPHYSNPIMNLIDFIEVLAKWGQSRPTMGTAQPSDHTSQSACDLGPAVTHACCHSPALLRPGHARRPGGGVAIEMLFRD